MACVPAHPAESFEHNSLCALCVPGWGDAEAGASDGDAAVHVPKRARSLGGQCGGTVWHGMQTSANARPAGAQAGEHAAKNMAPFAFGGRGGNWREGKLEATASMSDREQRASRTPRQSTRSGTGRRLRVSTHSANEFEPAVERLYFGVRQPAPESLSVHSTL